MNASASSESSRSRDADASEVFEAGKSALNFLAGHDWAAMDQIFEEFGAAALGAWRDADGETLLIRAAREASAEWVAKLAPHSCPQAVDGNGETAFLVSASAGCVDCLRILTPISDAFHQAINEDTALMRAANLGDQGLLAFQFLLTHPKVSSSLWFANGLGINVAARAIDAALGERGFGALSALLDAVSTDPIKRSGLFSLAPQRIAKQVAALNAHNDAIEAQGLRAMAMIAPFVSDRALLAAREQTTAPDSLLSLVASFLEARELRGALDASKQEASQNPRRSPRL